MTVNVLCIKAILIVALGYVVLASPPRHQNLRQVLSFLQTKNERKSLSIVYSLYYSASSRESRIYKNR